MHCRSTPLLLVIALVIAGCGESEPEDTGPEPLDAKQVMMQPFDPPADGRLTQELLDHYVMVLNATRENLASNGFEGILEQSTDGMSQNERKSRDKKIATARTRAQMAMGMPKSQFNWIKKRILKVDILARKDPPPDSPDGQEIALVAAAEKAYGHDF